MSRSRRPLVVRPVPRERVLDQFEGQWVAMKDGRVIAHGFKAHDVAVRLNDLGAAAEGAVIRKVARATDAVTVGLG